jgi:hypothetical protein
MSARFWYQSDGRGAATGLAVGDILGGPGPPPASRACCCPARSVVRVIMPPAASRPRSVDLLLCGHHYRVSSAGRPTSRSARCTHAATATLVAAGRSHPRHRRAPRDHLAGPSPSRPPTTRGRSCGARSATPATYAPSSPAPWPSRNASAGTSHHQPDDTLKGITAAAVALAVGDGADD